MEFSALFIYVICCESSRIIDERSESIISVAHLIANAINFIFFSPIYIVQRTNQLSVSFEASGAIGRCKIELAISKIWSGDEQQSNFE